jgi:hypothetical protein
VPINRFLGVRWQGLARSRKLRMEYSGAVGFEGAIEVAQGQEVEWHHLAVQDLEDSTSKHRDGGPQSGGNTYACALSSAAAPVRNSPAVESASLGVKGTVDLKVMPAKSTLRRSQR